MGNEGDEGGGAAGARSGRGGRERGRKGGMKGGRKGEREIGRGREVRNGEGARGMTTMLDSISDSVDKILNTSCIATPGYF